MKLEAGKFYKCSCGDKAKIICTDVPGEYEIAGYTIAGNGLVHVRSWTNLGKHSNAGDSIFDLISEWVDEPKTKKVTLRRAILSSQDGDIILSRTSTYDYERHIRTFIRWATKEDIQRINDGQPIEVPVKE